jgi:hypothetical protein
MNGNMLRTGGMGFTFSFAAMVLILGQDPMTAATRSAVVGAIAAYML